MRPAFCQQKAGHISDKMNRCEIKKAIEDAKRKHYMTTFPIVLGFLSCSTEENNV